MTLAILSALAEEQQGIFEQLEQARRVIHAGREFGLGVWHGQSVVLALSRIGKVAAATTATALIEKFGVERIVFTGVAGGVGDGVQVGDVVVARDFVQHDMDAAPLFPTFEIPLYGQSRFACDPALTAMLLEATGAGVSSASGLFSLNQRIPQVHHGLVASGDRFVSAAVEVQRLQARLRAAGHEALAVEMEGAAVAQVCHDYGIPFAAMRTISDRADDSAHVDFPEFVRTVASRYAQAILAEFMQRL
ncbi:5'-methylthioadenosine/adenosylhomocysteine nucleosidase [Rhodoferax sp.]|uniref:5'-methylthioadenosine/adenosylhomocysteine nucleosidase n=1 Tax=Rhodoferax sp. TaxID=50421 RepID=UPI00374CBD27